ncbi:MAG: hypothetical protein ACRC8S_13685 [Fimbriiglobus sp.]
MAAKMVVAEPDQPATGDDELSLFKDYLAEPRFRIRLDDLVIANVRVALRLTGDEHFSPNGRIETGKDVVARLQAYEDTLRPLQANAVLLGKWATAEQRPTLAGLMSRMAENCTQPQSGTTIWLNMRWYPLSLLAYSAGIAALSAENYAAFVAVHTARVDTQTRRRGDAPVPVIQPVVEAMVDLGQAWKAVPGQEQKYTPESEYMFKFLRPVLNDLLFLGGGYEQLFDRYEILRALVFADLTDSGWAPVGRFGWKHSGRGSEGSPFAGMLGEAEQQKDAWGPIRAGLFRGSYARFDQVAKKFASERLDKLRGF